jgi:sugar/nucleoside kinase (ribokinase family)
MARSIREKVGLESVVIHPRDGAAAAIEGQATWFEGPFCARPRLSTGAGDHFNAGFALARIIGLALDECLAAGCATSGAYVRDGASPDIGRLAGFLRSLPGPEQAAG